MQPELGIAIGIAGVAILTITGYFLRERRQSRQALTLLQEKLARAEEARSKAALELQAMLRASRQFIEADGEEEIVSVVIHLSMELTKAMGASFVPLDERGQPTGAIREGDFPFPLPDAWLEYLASPVVRQTCAQCHQLETLVGHNCNLLKGPFSNALGLYCFPLRYGNKELGLLNLYMPDPELMDGERREFLRMLLDASGMALEGERLRRHEMETLARMQSTSLKSDMNAALTGMLAGLRETLKVDFARIVLPGSFSVTSGDASPGDIEASQAIVQLTMERQDQQITSNDALSLISLPLNTADRLAFGVLVLGSHREGKPGQEKPRQAGFSSRQAVLAQNIADQMAVAIQAATRLAEVQYQVMIDERTRLAREIHDGLAQTLGFLKLQVAQMQGYADRGDQERLRQLMRQSYSALTDAYRDAREAIEMLRVLPGHEGSYSLAGWLNQIVREFNQNYNLKPFEIEVTDLDIHTNIPPEVHAQLIRIVQEALSNTRKHAQAHQVWISCREIEQDLVLELRDDGQGFSVDDIPGPSRHGLRGMRERSELIGADFQVISRPGEGTTVRVRLPLDDSAHRAAGTADPGDIVEGQDNTVDPPSRHVEY